MPRKKKEPKFVAITSFGAPGDAVYVAPGDPVDDILDDEGIEYYLAKGCITYAGTADDPNTWNSETPTPRAPTVGEMLADIKKRLGFETGSHTLATEFGKDDIPELNQPVVQSSEDPDDPDAQQQVDLTKKEGDGS